MKLEGPLFSTNAKGRFAKTITYFTRNGQNMASPLGRPKKKRSDKQKEAQDKWRQAQDAWDALPTEEKAEWNEDARIHNDEFPNNRHVSGRCLFVSNWYLDNP